MEQTESENSIFFASDSKKSFYSCSTVSKYFRTILFILFSNINFN